MTAFLEHHEALRKARRAFTDAATAIENSASTTEIESLIGQTVALVLDVLDLVEQSSAEDQLLARLAEIGAGAR